MAPDLGPGGGFGKVIADKDDDDDPDKAAARRAAAEAVEPLDYELWEVVREDGKVVRAVTGQNRETNQPATGQAIVFRTTAKSGVIVTKTYRLFPDTDGFELELKFESPERSGRPSTTCSVPMAYRSRASGTPAPSATSSSDSWASSSPTPMPLPISPGPRTARSTTPRSPFASPASKTSTSPRSSSPIPMPTGQEDRWDSRTVALVLHKDEKFIQSDVGVEITSRPITVKPDEPVVHTVPRLHRPQDLPGPAPLRRRSTRLVPQNRGFRSRPTSPACSSRPPSTSPTRSPSESPAFFGGTSGNYGIAIILLTILVRGLMFPLGRKQALSAQKMQSLQPLLKELQDKYKEDKEKLTKETFALYKRHGVNPVSGCLPALIQLPIFVGLWQALNTSFPLRHASFLWIRDLAAPDMLFHIPFEIPFVTYYLGQWFNVLPFIVIGLMLFQTKLFAPPATTPEAEMQQKMMKYMMIFMGVMFYKVPSGLGIYFITSSLWAIGERLLLPKVDPCHRSQDADGKAGRARKALPQRIATLRDGPRGDAKQEPERNGDKDKAARRCRPVLVAHARRGSQRPHLPQDRRRSRRRQDRENERGRERERDRPRPKPRATVPNERRSRRGRLHAARAAPRAASTIGHRNRMIPSPPPPAARSRSARHCPPFGARRRTRSRSMASRRLRARRRCRVDPPASAPASLKVTGLRPRLPVMLALWHGPRSYTGQDVAEIHLIGSVPLLSLVLSHCFSLGRPARGTGRVHSPGILVRPHRSYPGRSRPGRHRGPQPRPV